jgi:siderophore synthetase component
MTTTDNSDDALVLIHAELMRVRAAHAELQLKIKRREMVDARAAENAIAELAHRVRDQVLTAPARHAAVIAAEFGLDPHQLIIALDQILRDALTDIALQAKQRERGQK